MQHEGLFALARQAVDDLRVAARAQRGHHQRLSFAAGEQGRTMGSRQNAGADVDGAHGLGVAAVDARMAAQDALAHQSMLEIEEFGGYFGRGELQRIALRQGFEQGALDLADPGVTLLFLRHRIRGRQILRGEGADGMLQFHDLFGRRPVPFRLACFRGQFLDRLDRHLHLFMAEHDPAQHDLFIQAVGFGLDHQHAFLGAGDHEIQFRLGQLSRGGIQHVLAVQITDARRADRTHERHARDRERRGGADQRGDIGIHFGIDRQHGGHHLHVVDEAFRKQRADRTVDQTRGERFLLGGPSFALEEAARNASGSVGLFLVIDGQRKEVAARRGLLQAHRGHEDHRFTHRHEHCAVGLTRQFARLDRDGVIPILKAFLDSAHVEPLM